MKTLRVRILSAATAIALLAGTAGVVSLAQMASAQSGGPTVVLSTSSASPTNAASVPVTATFSEGVSGFTSSDITVASGTVSNFASTSATVYTFDVTPTSDGSVTVTVPVDVAAATAPPNKTNQVSNDLVFTSDRTAPVISGVSVATTSTGATITWSTNEAADGQVFYGTTASYNASSTLNVTASTTHSSALTGLTPSTTYHYQVRSVDAAGNLGTTTDATFTTGAAALAPAISNIVVSGISSTTATVTWSTDLPATGQVSYGTTTSYGSNSTFNGTASTTHSALLSGLSEGTLYHFAVKSGNAVGTTTSSDMIFVTQSTGSSTPLHVDSTTAVQTSATADGLFSSGWVWVMHLTVPDNENAFRMSFTDWTGSAGTFQADNNVRISSAQSSNASTPATGIISPTNNYGDWLYLTGDTATTTPGRQIDVEIDVRIPVGTAAGSYTTTFNANSVPQNATSTAI